MQLSLPSSEHTLVAGAHRTSLHIPPNASANIAFEFVPLYAGRVPLPRMSIEGAETTTPPLTYCVALPIERSHSAAVTAPVAAI